MANDPGTVVRQLFDCWQARDIDGVLALCHDSISYNLHQQPHQSRFAGELRGKSEVGDYLSAVCDKWYFVEIVPGPMTVEGDIVRETTHFHARHGGPDGEPIGGIKRHEWLVIDGLVARCDEFQDADMIGAFIRYYG